MTTTTVLRTITRENGHVLEVLHVAGIPPRDGVIIRVSAPDGYSHQVGIRAEELGAVMLALADGRGLSGGV
jgi:hypothetical protein